MTFAGYDRPFLDTELDEFLSPDDRGVDNDAAPDPAERPYRLYSAADLDDLPTQQWIVDDAIPANSLVGLIGAKGVLKTFAALDLALHVATGLPWHKRSVCQSAVVYVYAEGPFGAMARVDAWCLQYHFNRAELPIWFLPRRIAVNDRAAIAALLGEIRALPLQPRLVFVDTLNQNIDGDEDGKGMGGFVAGCTTLRDALSATIVTVHHTPLGSEDRGRGHTAFDGALDTRLIVSRDAERLTIECTHQRNGVDGWTVVSEAIPFGNSLALKPSGPTGGALKGQRREILDVVHQQGPLTYSAWKKATEISPTGFKKALKFLKDNGFVEVVLNKYKATDAGRIALGSPWATGGTP